MTEEQKLKEVLSKLIGILEKYVTQLEELDPSTREGARVADAVTKLLGRIKDFEDRLTDEEADILQALLKARKTTVKQEGSNLEAAVEYIRLALAELGVVK
jgi:predicted transcriptional regulator